MLCPSALVLTDRTLKKQAMQTGLLVNRLLPPIMIFFPPQTVLETLHTYWTCMCNLCWVLVLLLCKRFIFLIYFYTLWGKYEINQKYLLWCAAAVPCCWFSMWPMLPCMVRMSSGVQLRALMSLRSAETSEIPHKCCMSRWYCVMWCSHTLRHMCVGAQCGMCTMCGRVVVQIHLLYLLPV